MPAKAEAVRPFPCTVGGAVASGRRSLQRGAILLSLLLLAGGVVAVAYGRLVPGALLLALAFALQVALRLFLDAEPEELRIEGKRVVLALDSGAVEALPLAGLSARRLTEEEIRHLARLAERAGLVLGGGSFDSHRLGEFDLHASDLGNAVLLRGEAGAWVVTPDEPEAFLAAIAATIAPS